MKAVLAIEHGQIPPTIGLINPNPDIDFDGARVKVVTETTPVSLIFWALRSHLECQPRSESRCSRSIP